MLVSPTHRYPNDIKSPLIFKNKQKFDAEENLIIIEKTLEKNKDITNQELSQIEKKLKELKLFIIIENNKNVIKKFKKVFKLLKKVKKNLQKEYSQQKSRNNSEILDILNEDLIQKNFKIKKIEIQNEKINHQSQQIIKIHNKVTKISEISSIIKKETITQDNKISDITKKTDEIVIVMEKTGEEIIKLNENCDKNKPLLFWLIIKTILFIVFVLALVYNVKY